MDARQVRTISDAREIVSARGVSHVRVGFVDLDGILRGKYFVRNKFFSSLESGARFRDVVFGWDSNDQPYDASTVTGWHTAFPDATLRIDPATCRNVPSEGDMLLFLGEFEGEAAVLCPRRLLGPIVDRAAAMGFEASAAAEFEFFVFDETPHSLRDKKYRDAPPRPGTPRAFGLTEPVARMDGRLATHVRRL